MTTLTSIADSLKKNWIPLLVLVVLGSIPFLGFLFSGKMLYGSDQIGGFGNYVQYTKTLHEGHIPGWNPWYLAGMPTFDAVYGDALYPPFVVLTFLVPIHKVLGYLMWTHVIVGGFGAYLLLRKSFNTDRWVSTALATAYMLNMNFLSIIHGGHTAKVCIQGLLPFAVHFLIQMLGPKSRWWHPLGLALTTGLMISTSHLQMVYYAMIAYFIYLLWRLWESRREGVLAALKRTLSFAVALGLGIGLAMPIFYPPMKFVKEFSIRGTAEKTSFEHATSWSLHPEEIGSLAFPEFAGTNETYWGRNPFKLNSEYAGIAITIMGIAAIFALRKRWTWYWGAIAGLSLLNGLGAHTPFYQLIYGFDVGGHHIGVPGIRNFRAASMVMFLFSASMVALSALWLKHLSEADTWQEARRKLWAKRLWIAAGVCGGVFALIGLAPDAVHDMWVSIFSDPSWPSQNLQNWPADSSAFQLGAFRTAVLSAGTLALSALLVAGNIRLPAMAAGILLITAIDLLPQAPKFITTFDKDDTYAAEPLITALQGDTSTWRVFEFPQSVTNGLLEVYGLESANGFADNEPAHMQAFRSRDLSRVLKGLRQNPDGTVQGSRVLDLLNVKYLLFRQKENMPLGAAPNRSFLPRARVVHSLQGVPLAAQLDGVLDSSFDYRRALLVEPSEAAKDPIAKSLLGRPVDTAATSSVTWSRKGWDDWTYRVKTSAPGVLALSESWYPHWLVEVDGKSAPLLRVDYALRGIAVPAGEHVVTMRFSSPWFELGKKLSLLSLLGLVAWAGTAALVETRRRKIAA